MGGPMELVTDVKRCIAVIDHPYKLGESKFLKACSLPLTGRASI